jgi:DNA-binding IclR family transcriptional regulator
MIQVLNRAFNILEFVALQPEKIYSLTEIADEQQLNMGTCANILKTLVSRGYIEQIGHKKGYRLGPMAYYLTRNNAYKRDLILAAEEPMQQLTKTINESSLLAITLDARRITLHSVECDHDIQARGKIDRPIFDSATGRLLLAYQTEAEQVRFIRTYGLPTEEYWPGVTTESQLLKALASIREDALSIVVTRRQIVGIAVPIFQQKMVVAALGVFLPEIRYTETRRDLIIREMQETASHIGQNLVKNSLKT